MLYAPAGFIAALKLDDFIDKTGTFLGFALIASASLVIINATIWAAGIIRTKFKKYKWSIELDSVLKNLDHSEKAVLREFYLQGQHTIDLPVDHATVVGLTNKRIIVVAGSVGTQAAAGILFACKIHKEVERRLSPVLIDMPPGKPTDEEAKRILGLRPEFANSIAHHKAIHFGW